MHMCIYVHIYACMHIHIWMYVSFEPGCQIIRSITIKQNKTKNKKTKLNKDTHGYLLYH